MHRMTAVLFWTALIVTSASASDDINVVLTVRKFFDSFNQGDMKTALDTCAAPTAIIDEFPPYIWQGATGCADWSSDFDAYAKKHNITEPRVVLGKAHINVSGDRAYVVVPAQLTFKQKGKRTTEQGSIATVALQKAANGWRITGWAWAKR